MSVEVFLGVMGAGKSTLLLQDAWNISEDNFILYTGSESCLVRSRIGPSKNATYIRDLIPLLPYRKPADYILIDECQFLEPHVVDFFVKYALETGVSVRAYGLISDFSGQMFPGTQRWITMADKVNFLQGIVSCWCSQPAVMNGRVVSGKLVKDGETIVEGDIEENGEIYYMPLCLQHWVYGDINQ
jgi:thymidine kinase